MLGQQAAVCVRVCNVSADNNKQRRRGEERIRRAKGQVKKESECVCERERVRKVCKAEEE
jgi:hypothetical protein